ncbi:hypothetical protein B0O99DRAFT_590452 [Bisporella sp. PMI_857]|nr:hypothetical protein B0O99DRAFT_590452 [Bisporella sp. PMI_857]
MSASPSTPLSNSSRPIKLILKDNFPQSPVREPSDTSTNTKAQASDLEHTRLEPQGSDITSLRTQPETTDIFTNKQPQRGEIFNLNTSFQFTRNIAGTKSQDLDNKMGRDIPARAAKAQAIGEHHSAMATRAATTSTPAAPQRHVSHSASTSQSCATSQPPGAPKTRAAKAKDEDPPAHGENMLLKKANAQHHQILTELRDHANKAEARAVAAENRAKQAEARALAAETAASSLIVEKNELRKELERGALSLTAAKTELVKLKESNIDLLEATEKHANIVRVHNKNKRELVAKWNEEKQLKNKIKELHAKISDISQKFADTTTELNNLKTQTNLAFATRIVENLHLLTSNKQIANLEAKVAQLTTANDKIMHAHDSCLRWANRERRYSVWFMRRMQDKLGWTTDIFERERRKDIGYLEEMTLEEFEAIVTAHPEAMGEGYGRFTDGNSTLAVGGEGRRVVDGC